jgi:hypothetical protein
MSKRSHQQKLPPPNVKFRSSGHMTDFSLEEIRGLVCNPVYAGFGPYPAIVTDEQWVEAAVTAINKDGAEQFLVNLLHMLRETFSEADA